MKKMISGSNKCITYNKCVHGSKKVEDKLEKCKYIPALIVTFNSCHIIVIVYHYTEIYTQDYSPV